MIKSITDILALCFLRILVLFLEFLPDKLAFRLAQFYVKIIFLLMPRLEKVARKNLEIAFPEKDENARSVIFKKSKDVLAENILGFARIPTLSKEWARKKCSYDKATEAMDRLHRENPGLGVLIPTIHFDAFEYFIQIHALNYGPVSILGRGFGLPRLDSWWNGRREMFGNTIFGRRGGYKEIVKRLKRGEDVVVLCDQNVKGNHAVFVDFFGVKAATTKTIALAALRSGSPILFGSPVQSSPGTFEVTSDVLPHPNDESGSSAEKIAKCTANLNQVFEKQIRRRPEAWFWIHRRWKTRPEGEPEDLYA